MTETTISVNINADDAELATATIKLEEGDNSITFECNPMTLVDIAEGILSAAARNKEILEVRWQTTLDNVRAKLSETNTIEMSLYDDGTGRQYFVVGVYATNGARLLTYITMQEVKAKLEAYLADETRYSKEDAIDIMRTEYEKGKDSVTFVRSTEQGKDVTVLGLTEAAMKTGNVSYIDESIFLRNAELILEEIEGLGV